MSDIAQQLLHIISSRVESSWVSYRRIFDGILMNAPEPIGLEIQRARWAFIRSASWSAHIDVEFGEDIRIYPLQTTLVPLLRAGLPAAVVCGAQFLDTSDQIKRAASRLKSFCAVKRVSNRHFSDIAPPTLLLEAETYDSFVAIATFIKAEAAPDNAALLTLANSDPLRVVLRSLEWKDNFSLNWEKEIFDPARLSFSRFVTLEKESRARLVRYRDPATTISKYFIQQESRSAQIDPIWGRLAVLALNGIQVLQYDEHACELRAPEGLPIPADYARALYLCSGMLPRIGGDDDKSFFAFTHIPSEVAKYAIDALSNPNYDSGAHSDA